MLRTWFVLVPIIGFMTAIMGNVLAADEGSAA